MIIRSKAPLRISFAGGGTDLSSYCDYQVGYILNATINMYAHATIEPLANSKIIIASQDRGQTCTVKSSAQIPYDGCLDLLKAVYNRLRRDYFKKNLSFKLTTYVEAPAGSGLGSSSTLVVAVLKAFSEYQNLPLSDYDIAHLAWEIERIDMGMSGGKQDQYAAVFGGFNFMEFHPQNKVIVIPIRMKQNILNELEANLVLAYLGNSRVSSAIIDTQTANITQKNKSAVRAMDHLKEQAFAMKEALLTGRLNDIGKLLAYGWQEKKKTSGKISSPEIEKVYRLALKAGASGGKISGAGGGGFFTFFCPDSTRYNVVQALEKSGKEVKRFNFTDQGVQSWVI
ncbi:MAG: dehydrogenase [Candidatus Margulisbacteria bacterium]|jgi:D-glycero-alpha-D-manno-heptose-7-phosphate kinase|nr:dehydrogenase [Candidatus Margulisiibacteriota bacterium]